MQKMTRVVLAVLAVAGSTAAMAQSSVTLYGRVNTTVERQKVGDVSTTGLFNNSSRFGFKGTEDLGGGLKAGFQLESGFNSDTGAAASTFFGRQSEVNLSGNFGMVRLGNFFAESYYATADYVSLHNHNTGSSSDAFYAYVMPDANKIAYRAPALGNLTLEAAVSMHEQAVGGKNAFDLAANYNLGALALGAGYSKQGDVNQVGLRALYTVGAFTVGGYYQRDKNAYVLNGGSRDNIRLVGAYNMGASEFHVNVGRAGEYKNVNDSDATQFTLGYNYNLSKRTKVYGYYTKVNNSSNAGYMTGANGVDFSSVAVGVRHNF
ncbi:MULTISPECIES: porin [unclassified Acidovorax]|jgi:predicted porin|uniref:porin n=1 Tax=unclassified Acidovorax TaxID=2684926 RepID=UPI000BD34917|nr:MULTISPECIES: porin [unclassified Acidovorax]MDZ4239208.1 porin [Hydrogenophaga sp.]HQS21722.1 porin [Acidovorax defluvii]OYY28346.1 MAG: porin [Acidovorax sp. 35-64-16]OYY87630.1 MAG: porin [Acidovorax sp. 28-64-14]OYZ45240.1 MAG: porin [Acidovorax sp. 16-64-162]